MKAIVHNTYGSVKKIEYKDVKKPEITDDTILVKIHAASINMLDIHVFNGKPLPLRYYTGLIKPKCKILGSDISGVIEEIGKDVEDYKVGQEVFGQILINQEGGFAEYALLTKNQLATKPKNVTHSEAASVPIAGLSALQSLRQAGVTNNTNLLIYGASGGVGTFLIQIAKSLGASVTAVCSTRNIEVAKTSGADVIIDYKKNQWDKDNIKYDVIIGVNGYNSLKRYRDGLTDDGTYISVGGELKTLFQMIILKPLLLKKRNKKFLGFMTKVSKSDLDILSNMLENKNIKPYIDNEFLLENSKEALLHFINGKTIGKTIIRVV